jgi:hypothetical protein
MSQLTSLDKFVLDTISRLLIAKGYGFTSSEVKENVREISAIDLKHNLTQNSLYYLWTKYNADPPKPPYNYYFETQKEAENFAERVKSKHDVNCDIDLIDFRKWKLTEKKELV